MEDPCHSVVELSHESLRPDLEEARIAPDTIKEQLHYRDEAELDTGMQKVQQLDVLDKEIDRYKTEFSKAAAKEPRKSDVPAQVLACVNQIIALAKKNQTGVFKASQILEFIFDAFEYGEFASRDTFDLSRWCLRTLEDHDEALKKTVGERFSARMENAEKLISECFQKLAQAHKEASDDLDKQSQRLDKDNNKFTEEALLELYKQAMEIISTEKDELATIKSHCCEDANTIDEKLDSLMLHMDRAKSDYRVEEKKKVDELERNTKRQRELEDELRKLKARENQLKDEVAEGKELQQKVDEALKESKANVLLWKANIIDLQNKTETSLEIMNLMDECTQTIMEDAIKRKREWMNKLEDLKVDGLLALRDVVVATSIEHMAAVDDCNNNLEEIKTAIRNKEAERLKSAQTGFTRRVKELMSDLENYNSDRVTYEQNKSSHSQALESSIIELKQIDEKLHMLRPKLLLDTLEGRFDRFKHAKDHAFSKQNGVLDYTSRSKYN